ncbi:8-amino-7-oxononanoate synthase [Alteromonas sp. a30]|uniref:8-amino-7-oxononanoate synthase n=1 Tax=Alteromonas sp. a30 TaxID=2730917 RepID=UPI002282DDD7|nr:8-amino-7-oxononanoate synthase [Alteromonas sp. a30]MCY7294002.1 8-amino-7-oxononanoate synthase [Alteromonas sp. a30]
MAFSHLQRALQEREAQALLRQEHLVASYEQQFIRVKEKQYCNFSSNDYLGLAQLETPASLLNHTKGSASSPLVTGYSEQHQALVDYLAHHLKREAVLLFNSGFSANNAIASALSSPNQSPQMCILADKLVHASIIDGALASGAQFKRFRHNSVEHCQQLLTRQQQLQPNTDVLVMTESVFSMDGDKAPIAELAQLSLNNHAWLSVDDAHGFGVLGENGLGITDQGFSQQEIPVLMGTFGKAIGTGGAFVAGSHVFINYLKNFAREYIYSTAFSPFHASLTLHHLQQCYQQSWRREKLHHNIRTFQEVIAPIADAYQLVILPSDTAIQPLIIGCPEKTMQLALALKQAGFWVTGIRYPTVPRNTDRIRFTLTSQHTVDNIQTLGKTLAQVLAANARNG